MADPAPTSTVFKSVCPVHRALVLIGDRWTLILIRDLFFRNACYYGDFLKGPEKISSNILASRLQKLELEGLIEKMPVPNDPSRLGYYATEKALDLMPVMVEMMIWADQYYAPEAQYQPALWLELKEKIGQNKEAAIAEVIAGLRPVVRQARSGSLG